MPSRRAAAGSARSKPAAAPDALHEFADEEPERESVVAGALAGRVQRLAALDRVDHVVPVEHALGVVDHLADVVEAGLVGQHLPHRDLLLARLRELGPVSGDAVVVVE